MSKCRIVFMKNLTHFVWLVQFPIYKGVKMGSVSSTCTPKCCIKSNTLFISSYTRCHGDPLGTISYTTYNP